MEPLDPEDGFPCGACDGTMGGLLPAVVQVPDAWAAGGGAGADRTGVLAVGGAVTPAVGSSVNSTVFGLGLLEGNSGDRGTTGRPTAGLGRDGEAGARD